MIEKEWEICQADATVTCLTLLFQINHKHFLILIRKADTWYTKWGVCLLVGELSFINRVGVVSRLSVRAAKP